MDRRINMDNMDVFMNMIIYFAGGYLIYGAFLMKFKGQIPSGFISRNVDWDKAKDKDSYIKVMVPVNIAMGILMIGFGFLISYEDKAGVEFMVESLTIFGAFLMCLIYGYIAMRTQKKYLE